MTEIKDMFAMEKEIRDAIKSLKAIAKEHRFKWNAMLDLRSKDTPAAQNVHQRMVAVNRAVAELEKAYIGPYGGKE